MAKHTGLRRFLYPCAIALAAVAGCNAPQDIIDKPTAQGAAHLEVASGNNQSAVINAGVPSPLAVLVTNVDGAPVADVHVAWTVLTGGGTLSGTSVATNADGISSVGWTLGGAVGSQSVRASVAGLSYPVVFVANALSGPPGPPNNSGGTAILHFDGTIWSSAIIDGGVGLSYSSVWGASATRIFAAGRCRGIAFVSIFDGNHWSLPSESNCSSGGLASYVSVWGNSATDVLALRRDPLPPSVTSNILRYNGQIWQTSYIRSCSFCAGLNAVWSGANDAVAVGDSGMVVRFDGSKWNAQLSVTTEHLNAVWSAGAGNPVFAVGDDGTVVYYAGAAAGWQTQRSGTNQSLRGIWGSSSSDVFAVGASGTILHYDGTTWTAQTSGTTQNLAAVWGPGNGSVFAVGAGGTVVHYDGATWTAKTTDPGIDLAGVWGASATNVYAVGTPRYP
ncbi:MAG: hypothetical protein ACJ79Q_11000 [Gemmatimonadaceae bacterium]